MLFIRYLIIIFFFSFQFIGSQILLFILGLSGSAVLLDNSTQQSKLQPLIRENMRRLIMNSHHEKSKQILSMVQENVSELYRILVLLVLSKTRHQKYFRLGKQSPT